MASHYGEKDMNSTPTPEMLGTGGAAKAAGAAEKHKADLCNSIGGMYDFAAHKCRKDVDNK